MTEKLFGISMSNAAFTRLWFCLFTCLRNRAFFLPLTTSSNRFVHIRIFKAYVSSWIWTKLNKFIHKETSQKWASQHAHSHTRPLVELLRCCNEPMTLKTFVANFDQHLSRSVKQWMKIGWTNQCQLNIGSSFTQIIYLLHNHTHTPSSLFANIVVVHGWFASFLGRSVGRGRHANEKIW